MVIVKLSFEKSCRDHARTSKEDRVINKLGMIYILDPTGNTKPKELIILLTAVQLEAEDRGLNNIDHRRQGEALTETMRGFEKISCSSIYQQGYPRRFDTGLDPSNKPRVKSKSKNDLKEKFIFKSIKGIS